MSDLSFSPGVLWWLFLALFSPLVVVGVANTVFVATASYKVYIWPMVGVTTFLIVNRLFLKGTDDTIRTFSHELNPAVVSLMLFKKVHSFHVESDHGVVYHTAGGKLSTVLISLAPYTLPFFSYVLLIERAAMLPHLYWIADMLIGITIGFYISVFRQDIRPDQTDISQYRHRVFPYWFIFTFIIFNLTVILNSLLPQMNVFKAFANIFIDYWYYVVDFVNCLK
jgi:hypothetical protein